MTTADAVPATADLIDRARRLQPLLREFADYGDTHRRAADEVIEALTEAGMFRLFTPRRFGGYEVDLGTLLTLTETLGEADGSAAWLVSVAATSSWLTAHAPEPALAEIFGADPDARLAGGGAGTGTGRHVDGGAVVTGTWSYASGSPHASWATVLITLVTEDGAAPTKAFSLMPMTDLVVKDTWHTNGLRGTGSNTLVANDVFVPEHRLIPMTAEPRSDLGTLYRLPMPVVGTTSLLGALLGVGSAALDHVIGRAGEKAVPHTVFDAQSQSVAVQMQIAEAALKLQTARLHTRSVAETWTQLVAEAGRPAPAHYFAQALAENAHAARQILDAVNLLATIHGASSLADSNPMQRLLRDVGTGARHAAFNTGVGNEVFGKALLGVDEPVLRL